MVTDDHDVGAASREHVLAQMLHSRPERPQRFTAAGRIVEQIRGPAIDAIARDLAPRAPFPRAEIQFLQSLVDLNRNAVPPPDLACQRAAADGRARQHANRARNPRHAGRDVRGPSRGECEIGAPMTHAGPTHRTRVMHEHEPRCRCARSSRSRSRRSGNGRRRTAGANCGSVHETTFAPTVHVPDEGSARKRCRCGWSRVTADPHRRRPPQRLPFVPRPVSGLASRPLAERIVFPCVAHSDCNDPLCSSLTVAGAVPEWPNRLHRFPVSPARRERRAGT